MASTSKIRCLMNPGEVESYVLQEKGKLKVARLLQVRLQSKEAAAQIRQSVQKEKEKQLEMAGSKAKAKKLRAVDTKLDEWSNHYSKCLNNIGESHANAELQEQLLKAQRQRAVFNNEVADIRGKEAEIKMKISKNQKRLCENGEMKKRQEAVKKENSRAAGIRNQFKQKKNPVDDLDLKRLSAKHRSNLVKTQTTPALSTNKYSQKKPAQKNLPHSVPENKENVESSTQTLSSESEVPKRSASRKKLRVSVGYKNQKSKTILSRSKTGLKRKNRSSSKSSVSSLTDERLDAGQVAIELNAETSKRLEEQRAKEISSDNKCKERFKSAMDKVKTEKNCTDILQALEKLEKAEQIKNKKERDGKGSSPQKSRQILQLHLEKLVENMLYKRSDATSSSPEDTDDNDIALTHKTLSNSPEMIKIISPSVMDSFLSPASSPDDYVRRSSPDMNPSYLGRSPTLKPSGFKNYRLSTLPSAQMRWVDKSTSQSDNHKNLSPKPIRRNSVHKDVITRQLLRNFLENRGVQTPTPKKKAFTKSYIGPRSSPLFPDLSKDSTASEFAIDRIHRSPEKTVAKSETSTWAEMLDHRTEHEVPAIVRVHRQPEVLKVDDNQSAFSPLTEPQPQTESSLGSFNHSDVDVRDGSSSPTESNDISDSQSESSVIRDERKLVENELKINECSKEMARIDDEQRQLQLELEDVRKRKRELGLPPIDESKQTSETWDENAAVNVTFRKRCPPTYHRAMDTTPHELSTVMEIDTPRSSYASTAGNNEPCEKLRGLSPVYKQASSTPKKVSKPSKLNTPEEPGIMEEPEITLVEFDAMSSVGSQSNVNSPSLVKNNHFSQNSKFIPSQTNSPRQLSPMTTMLHNLRDKLTTPKSAREHVYSPSPQPTPDSLSDSLMSFQRHELSAYSDLSQSTPENRNSPLQMSPEVSELLQKWKEKYKL